MKCFLFKMINEIKSGGNHTAWAATFTGGGRNERINWENASGVWQREHGGGQSDFGSDRRNGEL